MATNAEVTAAGFLLPTSGDYLHQGDDAINLNAHAAFTHGQKMRDEAKGHTDAEVAKLVPRVIPTNTDIDLMRGPAWYGRWSISSQARLDTLVNAPSWMTSGDVIEVMPGTGFHLVYRYTNGGDPHLYYRGRTTTASETWSPWQKIAPAPTVADPRYSAGYGAMGHETRQGFALRKLGGTIGTAGRAAVALRFDDNPAAFRDKVLPILREFDVPGYIASATRYYDETAVPYADAEGWAVNDGVSIANHTETHADSTSDAAIWDNTVGAADALEAAMPKINVDVWTMPSMSGTKMLGYDDGRYPQNFLDTTAGRAIASRHAVVNGYSGGRFQPLIGRPTFGQTHLTIEAMTYASAKIYIDEAAAAGVGLTLMLHPSRLDGTGYMSTATFRSVVAYLAALREEGTLLLLGPLGIGFADAGHSRRHNMLPAGTFPDESSTAVRSASVLLSPNLSQRGAVCELVARVDGPAGAVFRTGVANTAAGLTATKDHTIPATGWREVRKLFTIPATMPYDGAFDVTVGTVSGGPVTVRDVRMRAL